MAKPGREAGLLLLCRPRVRSAAYKKARLAAGLSISAEGGNYFAGAVFM
jgi:hypothetical protein